MHTYYVLYFMHLHVSVPLDHLQGAFCDRIYVTMCMSNIQVFIVIWSEGKILCCVLKMLKLAFVKVFDTPCISVCVPFSVQVESVST